MTAQDAFTIQAEDMTLAGGYRTASAEGKTFIENRSSDPGTASTTFGGQTGTYDISLAVFDECDGESLIELLVDGVVVGSVRLDDNGGSNYIAGSDAQVSFAGIEIPAGATVTLRGTRDDGEMARIDAITFDPVEVSGPVTTTETTIIELKFDGDNDATAASEVQNDAVLKNGAKIKNDALLLDGRNDYAVVAADDDFAVDAGNLEIVFNADDTDHMRTLASRDSSGFDGGGHLTIYVRNDQLYVRLQSDDQSYWLSSGHKSIKENRDYTMNFEFGEDGMKLLINGEVVDTNDYTGGLGGNNEPWVIGANQWSSSDNTANNIRNYFDGEIKNFKLTGVEEAPAYDAVDDAFTTGEDDVLTGDLFANDVAAEGVEIAALSNGTVGEAITLDDDLGTLTVNADGTFTVTPGAGANALNDGETATVSFDYQVQVGTNEVATSETKTIDFENFATGATVTSVDGAQVWVDADGRGSRHDEAMIFDSNNPTGGDWDLGTSTQDNILIISEDSHSWDPDDNASGGKIFFKFDDVSSVESLTFIDNEEGAWVGFFDENWNEVSGSKWVSGTANNSINTVAFNSAAATYMMVDLRGSGAIDDLVFTAETGVTLEPVFETATATITIVGEDDLKLIADTYTTTENEAGSGNLLANDEEAAGVSIDSISLGALGADIAVTTDGDRSGTLVVNADGTFTFTPGADADGMVDGETDTLSFTYSAGGQTATVTITVEGETDGRLAVEDSVSVAESGSATGNVLGNDEAGDLGPLAVTDVAGGEVGETITLTTAGGRTVDVTINADGSYSVTPTVGAFTDLNDGETDTVSIAYSIGDVLPEDALIVNGGFENNPVGGTWGIVDSIEGWTKTGTEGFEIQNGLVGGAGNSVVELDGRGNAGIEQTITVGTDGTFDLNFDYTPRERGGEVAATSLMNVLVDGVVVATISEDSVATFGKTLALTLTAGEHTIGFEGAGLSDSYGARLDNVELVRTSGAPVVNPDETAELVITIDGESNLSVAVNDAASTDEDSAVSGNVLSNDIEGDDALTVASIVGATVGVAFTATSAAGREMEITLNADGSYTATPGAGFDDLNLGQTDTFDVTYALSEGQTATLSIDVAGSTDNEAPTLVDTRVSIDEDSTASANILTGSADAEGETITVVSTSLGAIGTDLTVTTDQGFDGTLRVEADGAFTFTPGPNQGFLSSDQIDGLSFTFTATDTFGNTASETVSILIDGRNDAPTVGNALATTVTEDTGAQTLDLLDGAADIDENDTLSVTDLTVTSGNERGATELDGTTLTIDTDASGVQSLGAGQSEVVTYSYTVTDGRGGSIAQSATLTIEGVNDAPTLAAPILSSSFDNDVEYNFDLLDGASDVDAGDSISVSNLTATGGKAGATNTGVAGISFVNNVMTVDPSSYDELNSGETVVINVSFDVIDENGGVTPQTATITVRGINDAPVAADDSFTIGQRTAEELNLLTGEVLPNDGDVDGSTITVTSINGQAVGSVVALSIPAPDGSLYTAEVVMDAAGNFTFTQLETTGIALGETEDFTFTYTIEDADGDTSTATVTVGVDGANENPVALDDTNFETNEENQLSGNLLANDTDGDFTDVLSVNGIALGSLQTIEITTVGGRSGQVRLDSAGNFTFVPNEEFQSLDTGEFDTFTIDYTASDGNGGFDTATANFTVFGLDEPVVEPETRDIINMVFVIDNSISMSAQYTDAFESFASFFGGIDERGNMNGVNEKVDLALLFTNSLTQAVAQNRDTTQPDFVNVNDTDATGEVIDVTGLTPEQRGGTIVNSAIVGFSDDVDFFEVYEVDDTSLLAEARPALDTPGGAGSNYTAALEQVYDYLESAPLARQTKIYFLSDGNSTSSDFEEVANRIEDDFGAEIESIALASELSGGVNATTRANAIASGSYDSLVAIDTDQPGDFMDVVTSFRYVSTLSAAEDDELVFEPTDGPTIFDALGNVLPDLIV